MMLKDCDSEHIFMIKLQEYIQDKSALRIDNFLNRNKNEWKHEIPEGMISLAVCTTTIRNKIEMNESPIKTLKTLKKWNCELTENGCKCFRLLLYEFYTLDDDDSLLNASFDIIEYFFFNTSVDIQYFDCRGLGEEESLLMVSSPQWVDYSIHNGFNKINQLRDKKLRKLTMFLHSDCHLESPYNEIIAEYAWGGHYIFHFDEADYNTLTGEYKDYTIQEAK